MWNQTIGSLDFKKNDHKLEKFLNFGTILIASAKVNVYRGVKRIHMLILGYERLNRC